MIRRIALAFAALALAALPSCGGAVMREPPLDYQEPAEDPAQLAAEQAEHLRSLETALARPEPDCATACELGGVVCELRDRICAIAERHPDDEATGERCRDADARCDGANDRLATSCTCAPE